MLCFTKYNDNFGQYFEQKIFCILHKITKFSNVYYGHSNRKTGNSNIIYQLRFPKANYYDILFYMSHTDLELSVYLENLRMI